MTAEELMTGVLIGSMLIVLGVVPRWFQSLTEEVRNFGDSLSSPFAVRRKYETVNGKYEQPLWLAVIGFGLIAICVMGYF